MNRVAFLAFSDELQKIATAAAKRLNKAFSKTRPGTGYSPEWQPRVQDNIGATRYTAQGPNTDVISSAPGREALP